MSSPEFAIEVLIEELKACSCEQEAQGIFNAVSDKLRAHSFSLDFLQDITDLLISCMVVQTDSLSQNVAAQLIQEVYQLNHAVSVDLTEVLLILNENDPGMIINVLMLAPIAQHHRDMVRLAHQCHEHSNQFVAKTAQYALSHLQ